MCTTTAADQTCTNSGTAAAPFTNNAAGANQNATTTNSGTADGFASQTKGGGNAAVNNSGNNIAIGLLAQTVNGGDATASNSGSDVGNVNAVTFVNGNAAATNSGTITMGGIQARTLAGGNATATNSGSLTGGVAAVTLGGGNATATNSGSDASGIAATTVAGGDATATNSGTANGVAAVTIAGGNATTTNSGSNTGPTAAITNGGGNATATNSGSNIGNLFAITSGVGNATVTNSGTTTNGNVEAITGGAGGGSGDAVMNNSGSVIHGSLAALANGVAGNAAVSNSGLVKPDINPMTMKPFHAIDVVSFFGNATLTNVVGARVIGGIVVDGAANFVNFVGGNWLLSIDTSIGPLAINTGGAPFVVVPTATGSQVVVLDPTAFALADRTLVNFTGGVSQILQDRFNGMAASGGGPGALGFAAASGSPVADQAQAAFAGIPSVAMSYASNSRPIIGKAAAAAPVHYDTTVWASGFGGERRQHADGSILPTTDTAYGGAMGVDRIVSSDLRLGAFVGAGASREKVELDVQSIDATYVFGGVYGRFDWRTQYLDFALYGGGINNKSTRGVANNMVASGFESATASYGGWFISPEVTYGYRIPIKSVLVTPRLRVRYVGGELDGFSESGSMQNLTVGRRAINDLEERAEVELSTVHPFAGGTMKALVNFGAIGLERLGNPTINTVLLAQSLSFTTPGQRNAVGGVLGAGLEYWPMPNVSLFLAGEGTAMSDKSASFAGKGGARVSF